MRPPWGGVAYAGWVAICSPDGLPCARLGKHGATTGPICGSLFVARSLYRAIFAQRAEAWRCALRSPGLIKAYVNPDTGRCPPPPYPLSPSPLSTAFAPMRRLTRVRSFLHIFFRWHGTNIHEYKYSAYVPIVILILLFFATCAHSEFCTQGGICVFHGGNCSRGISHEWVGSRSEMFPFGFQTRHFFLSRFPPSLPAPPGRPRRREIEPGMHRKLEDLSRVPAPLMRLWANPDLTMPPPPAVVYPPSPLFGG